MVDQQARTRLLERAKTSGMGIIIKRSIANEVRRAETNPAPYGPDTQVAKTLIALEWRYLWVLAPPMIAFTLGASLVIVRYAALPQWIGWIGFPVAITLLVPWIGFPVAVAWVLVVSIVLVIQAWRTPQPKEAN